ncbi:MAG: biliverdin-producing heme oxygenase [Tistlia sp.]|uniref:biliverdin-producing heme oxygenase n=1 Tax=Tistlia sp. TaxID=3057121 RepID=UPI0034A1A3C6
MARHAQVPLEGEGQNLRFRLRREIEEVHARLDEAFARLDFARRRDYERFLSVSASVVPALELALERGGIEGILPDWPRRRRRHALLADLERLGLAAPAPVAVEAGGRHRQLGLAYALEGSRNGARLMMRVVARSDDPAVRATTGFLGHGGSEALWTSFLALLDRRPASESESSEASAGARAVFEAYLVALDACPGRPS